jgi:hypothetical protein
MKKIMIILLIFIGVQGFSQTNIFDIESYFSYIGKNVPEDFDKMDDIYWAKASVEEKIQTVTFLRECFYGEEATTGRLQRFYKILKFK